MEHIVQLLGVALIAFISTNIDDFFLLSVFFSDDSYNKKSVIIGQYAGISMLILISCVGTIFKLFLPIQWVGVIGILPIIIGSKYLAKYVKDKKNEISSETDISEEMIIENSEKHYEKYTNNLKKIINIINPKVFFVAIVIFSNGGDNLSVYTPLFASLNLSELIFTIFMFFLMVAVWCWIVISFVKNKLTAVIFKKYGKAYFPFVLILLGIYITFKCNTLSLLIP